MGKKDVLYLPAMYAEKVLFRCLPLPRQGDYSDDLWKYQEMKKNSDWWYEIDLSQLGLPDGSYEYEFLVKFRPEYMFFLRKDDYFKKHPETQPYREIEIHDSDTEMTETFLRISDPFAEELTKFNGYRGVFHIRDKKRYRLSFNWDDNTEAGVEFPQNNEIVIYELPMRWAHTPPDASSRQVGLGTFEKALFKYLDYIKNLGVNAIELLPVFDSSDTLNWGYGTRYFWATDFDMGEPFDLKMFIRECHKQGIRVILDVVMNHSRNSPLEVLALEPFYLVDRSEEKTPDGKSRPDWGGKAFKYKTSFNGRFFAKEFHYKCAEFWIEEYHIDGFRIDEFMGIDNYDFIQNYMENAHLKSRQMFPSKPFIVIAEDSWTRKNITHDNAHEGKKIVDALWDFTFRNDLRYLVCNKLGTEPGKPSRSQRAQNLFAINFSDDFYDMAQRIAYMTSHDIEKHHEQRIFPFFKSELGYIEDDDYRKHLSFELTKSAFALMLTSVGIPMFLAGEEFADIHDTDRTDWRKKMSDPINWERMEEDGNRDLLMAVKELIRLRTSHPALHRNELSFFGLQTKYGKTGFHYSFDENNGERVLAFCRTGGKSLGSNEQVIVIANCSITHYPEFWLDWPWGEKQIKEYGSIPGQQKPVIHGKTADIELRPFQVRVFSVF